MTNLAIIGIGGYGGAHVKAARQLADSGLCRWTAVADTRLDAYPKLVAELGAQGIGCYSSHAELFANHPDLDLVTLPLPIMLHAPMTIECLERGVHVLVEKPPAATVADVQAMIAAAQRAGRSCGVAFQYSTSRMVERVCEAIAAGKLGRITDVSARCLAQRTDAYYARTSWAGKISVNGIPVRDGSFNNPFAHIAQLLLTFAGAAEGRAARPLSVTAELYAGHDIESEDTSAMRAALDTGATLHFCASLCSREPGTQIRVTGTGGEMRFNSQQSPEGVIRLGDGTAEPLPDLVGDGGTTEAVIRNCVEALEGRAARLACPVENTLGFVELVEGAFAGAPVSHLYGTPFVEREATGRPGETGTYLAGIEAISQQAFDKGLLYSEAGAPWASRDAR